MARTRTFSEIPDEWTSEERPAFADCPKYAIAVKHSMPLLPGMSEEQVYDPTHPNFIIAATKWQVAELEARHLESQAESLSTMLASRAKKEPNAKVLAGYRQVLEDLRVSAREKRRTADVVLEAGAVTPAQTPRIKAVHRERLPLSASRSALSSTTSSTHISDNTPTDSGSEDAGDDWL